MEPGTAVGGPRPTGRLVRRPHRGQPLTEDLEPLPLLRVREVPRASGSRKDLVVRGMSVSCAGRPGRVAPCHLLARRGVLARCHLLARRRVLARRQALGAYLLRESGRSVHRPDDPHIAPAAAEVGIESRGDLGIARVGGGLEESRRPQSHPRSAVPALRSALLHQGRLDRVQAVAVGEPLDRRDRPTGDLLERHLARSDGLAADEHRAGAACAFAATELRAGEPQLPPEVPEKAVATGLVDLVAEAVHRQSHYGRSNRSGRIRLRRATATMLFP
jgi:hypothetical protein